MSCRIENHTYENGQTSIHEHVVGHVKRVVQDVAELEAVHAVLVFGNALVNAQQELDLVLGNCFYCCCYYYVSVICLSFCECFCFFSFLVAFVV